MPNITRAEADYLHNKGEISDEQYASLLSVIIPSLWAETYLRDFNTRDQDAQYGPLHIRDYQRPIMDHPHRHRVLCLGRQIGKSFMLCIDAIHGCNTEEGICSLIVTPYKSQAKMLYDYIVRFVESSPYLELESKTKNPFEIWFPNNSVIKLFTAGVSSGSHADTLRGQRAHRLYIDEADYIDDESLDAIMMVTASVEEPRIWISSTPTGRKSYFYRIFHDPQYVAFNLPSHVSPTWDDDKDSRARLTLTQVGYEHEVLAQFTSTEAGVFRKRDIEHAFHHYRMENGDPARYNALQALTYDRIYIGVDWNESNNGVQMAVVGVKMPTEEGKQAQIFLIDKHVIDTEVFTQNSAIDKIMELNTMYNPKLIFADQGFGGTQIEIMHRIGLNDPATGLGQKLKGIDFYANSEVYDPILNQMVKKRNKHLMIDNLTRILERQMLVLPIDELGDTMLEQQLINYTVVRYTPTGQPVYECVGVRDHLFDAVLLGVNAFYMDEGALDDPLKIFKPAKPSHIPSHGWIRDPSSQIGKEIQKKGLPQRAILHDNKPTPGGRNDIDPGDPDPTRKIEMLPQGSMSAWYAQQWKRVKGSPENGTSVAQVKSGRFAKKRKGTRMTYA